jgi:hypothetical protein
MVRMTRLVFVGSDRSHPSPEAGERVGQPRGGLGAEEVFGFLEEDVAAYVGDGVGEGNCFGADFYAVLREAALLDAAVSGQGAEAFFGEDLASGMVIEELDLGDGGCADEAGFYIELRADFHAAGAGDAV